MKNIIKSFTLTAIISVPLTHAGTETGVVTIRQLSTGWEGSELYIWTNENLRVESCPSDGFIMPTNHRLADEMMSMILSAYHAGSKARFYIDGCMNGKMKVQAVKLCNSACE